MEILIVGNVQCLSRDFFKVIAEKNKIVLCGGKAEVNSVDNVSNYEFDIKSDEFARLFTTFSFDKVIYVSDTITTVNYSEIENLEKVIDLCQKRESTQFIYINPTNVISEKYKGQYEIIKVASDRLCERYVEKGGSMLDLEVPYIVSEQSIGTYFECILKNDDTFNIVYSKEQQIDLLFDSDLAEFLCHFFEEEESGCIKYILSGNNVYAISDFLHILFERLGKDKKIVYGDVCVERQTEKTDLRKKYGWFARKKADNYFNEWIENYKVSTKKKKTKSNNKQGWKTKIISFIEILVLFIVCELIIYKTRDNNTIGFVDFRLFFVIIAGMMYGLKSGIIASIVACISYFYNSSDYGNWQIQFYNIVNWLPFAVYMLTGAIAGYSKDKYEDMLEDSQEERRILETKYIYLNELYAKVLENKENYSNQIVNYRNSFGRIYNATKQLDSVLPGEIFYNAVAVIEDMLETSSVAIYSVDAGSSYARLNACSRDLMFSLNKSINIEDMEMVKRALELKQTWVNKERFENVFDYAYGVIRNDKLVGIIAIVDAQYNQMGMEYQNRFEIMSGLISDSLVRAIEYQAISERDIMIPDTKILKYEEFIKELYVQKRLKENNRANYLLLKVETNENDYRTISDKLLSVIRKNDSMGVDKEGNVYIILTQADSMNINIINKRINNSGIVLEKVEDIA